MSLKRCLYCGKEVSPGTMLCPHCGAQLWPVGCLATLAKAILLAAAVGLVLLIWSAVKPLLREWLLGGR